MNTTSKKSADSIPSTDITSDDTSAQTVVLTATHITKAYRRGWRRTENQVLTDANLTIVAGEVVGLVGENGSGKSTLMKIVVGSLDGDGGRSEIRGSFGSARKSRFYTNG